MGSKKECVNPPLQPKIQHINHDRDVFEVLTNLREPLPPRKAFCQHPEPPMFDEDKLNKMMTDDNETMNDQKDQESQIMDTESPVPEQKEDVLVESVMNLNIDVDEEKVDSMEPEEIVISPMNLENEENEDPNYSTIYCVSHLQKSNEYWDFSVRQLKDKLLSMHVSIDQCIEKRDLIQKIKSCHLDPSVKKKTIPKRSAPKSQRPKPTRQSVPKSQPKAKAKPKVKNRPSILYDSLLHDTRENQQQIINRAEVWLHRWSYRRSFRQVLNSVLDFKAGDRRYIARGKSGDQNYSLMMKSYKKAILLIHPDKHVNSSFEVKYKAAEMFKIMTSLCDKYRKKYAASRN